MVYFLLLFPNTLSLKEQTEKERQLSEKERLIEEKLAELKVRAKINFILFSLVILFIKILIISLTSLF